MKIDLQRLCHLAGVETQSRRSYSAYKTLNEASYEDDGSVVGELVTVSLEEDEHQSPMEAIEALEEVEGVEEEMAPEVAALDEMIEIDEVMLVQELRRAKRMMNESKRRKEAIVENELRGIVESEIENVLKQLNLSDGSWVYGANKPKRSRQGYTHQGSYLKGIGFK